MGFKKLVPPTVATASGGRDRVEPTTSHPGVALRAADPFAHVPATSGSGCCRRGKNAGACSQRRRRARSPVCLPKRYPSARPTCAVRARSRFRGGECAACSPRLLVKMLLGPRQGTVRPLVWFACAGAMISRWDGAGAAARGGYRVDSSGSEVTQG